MPHSNFNNRKTRRTFSGNLMSLNCIRMCGYDHFESFLCWECAQTDCKCYLWKFIFSWLKLSTIRKNPLFFPTVQIKHVTSLYSTKPLLNATVTLKRHTGKGYLNTPLRLIITYASEEIKHVFFDRKGSYVPFFNATMSLSISSILYRNNRGVFQKKLILKTCG